jgi:predicted alpha/beta superfamily hydrolase
VLASLDYEEPIMRRFGIIASLLVCAGLFSFSAHAALLPAKHETLQSVKLGQERVLEVSLPEESAKDPAQRFETLYVLDGDWNAKLVIQVVDFMHQLGLIPPLIVVSVPNYFDAHGVNSRDHDLTPSNKPDREPNSGGARQFLDFLKTELVPYVEQHYPTNGIRLIHGHSYGGLFLVYAITNEPQLFSGYMVLDPAMWWDKPWLESQVGDAFRHLSPAGMALFVAGRAGGDFQGMGIDSLEAVLKADAVAGLQWRVVPYERESHDSLKLKATYDALRFLFDDYSAEPLRMHPELGTLVAGHPLRFFVEHSYLHPRFTTDGTEPTLQSPGYTGMIGIADPDKVRFKLISRRGDFEQTIPVKVTLGSALPPLAAADATKEDRQWRYQLYAAGAAKSARALARGTTDKELTLKVANQSKVSGRVERVLNIASEGYYVFYAEADQAQVSLDGHRLFDTDEAKHERGHSYVAPLQRGRHRLTIDFTQTQENSDVRLQVLRCTDEEPDWWKPSPWLELASR